MAASPPGRGSGGRIKRYVLLPLSVLAALILLWQPLGDLIEPAVNDLAVFARRRNLDDMVAISVETPSVHTRERLLNDRFEQVAWLEAMLRTTAPPERGAATTDKTADDKPAADKTPNDKTSNDKPTDAPAAKQADRPPLTVTRTDTSSVVVDTLQQRQQYDQLIGLRDILRAERARAMLDDRHDMDGNTLYLLSFDTSVVPRAGLQGYAAINVTLTDDPNQLGTEPGAEHAKQVFEDFRYQDVFDTYVSWLERIRKQEQDYVRSFGANLATIPLKSQNADLPRTLRIETCALLLARRGPAYIEPIDARRSCTGQSGGGAVSPNGDVHAAETLAAIDTVVQQARTWLQRQHADRQRSDGPRQPSKPAAPAPARATTPVAAGRVNEDILIAAGLLQHLQWSIATGRTRDPSLGPGQPSSPPTFDAGMFGRLSAAELRPDVSCPVALWQEARLWRQSAVEPQNRGASLSNFFDFHVATASDGSCTVEVDPKIVSLALPGTVPGVAPRSAPLIAEPEETGTRLIVGALKTGDRLITPDAPLPIRLEDDKGWTQYASVVDVVPGRNAAGTILTLDKPVAIPRDKGAWTSITVEIVESREFLEHLRTVLDGPGYSDRGGEHVTRAYSYGTSPRLRQHVAERAASDATIGGVAGWLGFGQQASATFDGTEPEVVGFIPSAPTAPVGARPDPPDADRAARFGWLIAPRPGRAAASGGLPLEQTQLGATVAVPSWWRSAFLRICHRFVAANEIGKVAYDAFWREKPNCRAEVIRLPGTSADVSRQLGMEVITTPHALDWKDQNALPPLVVTSGDRDQPTALLIRGERLWRSTVVTLGGQMSDTIQVMPDMMGIVARFACIDPPTIGTFLNNDTKQMLVPVTVWTSEGDTSPGDVVVNPPPSGKSCQETKPTAPPAAAPEKRAAATKP